MILVREPLILNSFLLQTSLYNFGFKDVIKVLILSHSILNLVKNGSVIPSLLPPFITLKNNCLTSPFFWIRLAWPVRWTNTQVRETLSIFNAAINGGQTGSHSRSLTTDLIYSEERQKWFVAPWPVAAASTPASTPATPAARPRLKYTKRSDFRGED